MKRRVPILMMLAALPLTAAYAQSGAPAAMTPEETVRARQAAYGLSAATFAQMKATIDAGGDVRPYAFGARMLQRWARAIPAMFPTGSNVAPTRAKAEVWSDRAGFEQRAQAYADASGQLATAAQGGDLAAFTAAWTAVRESCGGCHDGYRLESN
ncbi:MAG: c-type cytochrome [Allosphingosinicella sp.]